MNKLRICCTVIVLCCITGVAKGDSSQVLPDSVVTADNVYRYMFSDTKKAEAIMEELRERKKMSDWKLDYTEGDLWFDTGRYNRALKCYTRVLDSERAKKDNTLYVEMLHRMISCCDCIRNEAAAGYFERLATLYDSIRNRGPQGPQPELAEMYENGVKDKTILRQQLQTRVLLAVVVIVLVVVTIVTACNCHISRCNVSLVRAVKESFAVRQELLQLEEECLALKGRTAAVQKARPEPQQPAAGESLGETKTEPSPAVTGREEDDDGKAGRDKEQIRRLVHVIDSRKLYLSADLIQKDVLEFVQIPAYRFGATFKKHTGVSFAEYINGKRMEHAVKLLTEHPEYTVEAIAGMCGIKSKQHFHRQFAAYTGLTPATFRCFNEKTDNQ